jgi:murein DD-endopeptidase MepM/ murein hydrolase activator NlpD
MGRPGASVSAVLALMFLAPASAAAGLRESFDLAVPAPPTPVTIDGREWLVYELHLTNFSREPLRITKIDVSGERDVVQAFEGADLAQRLTLAGGSRPDLQPLLPGERAIAYLEVRADARPPRALRHRVRFETADRTIAEVGGEPIVIGKPAGLILGPPLRGGPWAAVYAWEWPRGHRRVFYTVEGRARLPGRLAIDWVRKDAQGRSARGDADVVKNSLGHGADVLAVADARVAALRDGLPEVERVSANPHHSLDEKSGNYLALDLGDGRFAVYEHLAPGSIRVARGDLVKLGQVLAALGFTGDSTEPHLHFHVADSPSPLAGEGLPFEFERFRVRESGELRERERPAPGAVITFE